MALLLAAPSAQAAFPGSNGKIAYKTSHSQIATINPDGTGQSVVTQGNGYFPAWSPDGTKIAFARPVAVQDRVDYLLYVINADGSGETPLNLWGEYPAWSPDGTKLVYSYEVCYPDNSCQSDLYVVNADGSGKYRLTPGPFGTDYAPSWSPDGAWIAFHSNFDLVTQIYKIRPNGADMTKVFGGPDPALFPDWSPDGSKIAFVYGTGLATVNSDGTNFTYLDSPPASTPDGTPAFSPDGQRVAFRFGSEYSSTAQVAVINADGTGKTQLAQGGDPSWQPIPINAYPRPRGASPLHASLVPAFKQCSAPNETHGAPLSFGSCSSPQQASSYLTVGTPDANGLATTTTGSVRYTTVLGNPSTPPNEADLKIDVSITGVLNRADLTPYSGELSADAGLRVTDRNNTPSPGGPGAATVQDGSFPVTVPCTSSTCAVATTANALVPGAVLEGKRAIWQLDQVKVYDGGADGLASTAGDNTVFMDQGVFVP